MRDVVICEPVCTPIGRYGGMFKDLTTVRPGSRRPARPAGPHRHRPGPDRIGDVILGHCNANSEAPTIGRVIALDAGLPVTVPGQHLDRRCGPGLQAVINAVMQVLTGAQNLVVAGGTESMSNTAFYSTDIRWGGARTGVRMHDGLVRARSTAGGRFHPVPGGMLETAENLRREYHIPRDEQDRLALSSHQRAVAAQQAGVLAEEIVAVTVSGRNGDTVIDTDEHPRPGTTLETLTKLRPCCESGAQRLLTGQSCRSTSEGRAHRQRSAGRAGFGRTPPPSVARPAGAPVRVYQRRPSRRSSGR